MFDSVMAQALYLILVPLVLLALFLTGIKFYVPKKEQKNKPRKGKEK